MRGCIAAIALSVAVAVGCNSGPAGTPVRVGRLQLVLPAGWQQVPPVSSMRAAQATISGPAGNAEFAVFFFGAGQGGAVEANLQRWMNQMVPGTGAAPQRETFENGGLRVTWVDARGTLKPGEMGMGPPAAQPDARLLGAVIEGDGGPWFLKATGPEATLGSQRDAFIAMLHAARLNPG